MGNPWPNTRFGLGTRAMQRHELQPTDSLNHSVIWYSRPVSHAVNEPSGPTQPLLRIARPTDDLAAVVAFYRDGLGFEVLAEFRDHDGFDGVILGAPGAAYHLEFTRKAGHVAGRAPSQDHLLVFYLPETVDWHTAVARLEQAGHVSVPAFNPYWDRHGRTFEDPDGYRVVLQNAAWRLQQ